MNFLIIPVPKSKKDKTNQDFFNTVLSDVDLVVGNANLKGNYFRINDTNSFNVNEFWNQLNTGDMVLFYNRSNGIFLKSTLEQKLTENKVDLKLTSKALWDDEKYEYIIKVKDVEQIKVKDNSLVKTGVIDLDKKLRNPKFVTKENNPDGYECLETLLAKEGIYQKPEQQVIGDEIAPIIKKKISSINMKNNFSQNIKVISFGNDFEDLNITDVDPVETYFETNFIADEEFICAVCLKKLPIELISKGYLYKEMKLDEDDLNDVRNMIPVCNLGCSSLLKDGILSFNIDLKNIDINKKETMTPDLFSTIKTQILAKYSVSRTKNIYLNNKQVLKRIKELKNKYKNA